MKISELVRMSGVSRSTVHLYLNSGLLPPPLRRGPKLHLYGGEHLERLREIRRLQEHGMSLAQIRKELAGRAAHPSGEGTTAPSQSRRGDDELGEHHERRSGHRSRKAATARARIIEAAARLFRERGYERVRMSDVARESGVAKTTLYECFQSKSELFVACLDVLLEDVYAAQSRFLAREGASLQTDVEQYAAAMITSYGSYRMIISALAAAAFDDDPRLAERARAAFERLVMLIAPALEGAMQAKRIRPMDTELLTYMTWGALLAVGARLARNDHRYTLRQGLDLYLDFVANGVRPRVRTGSPGEVA